MTFAVDGNAAVMAAQFSFWIDLADRLAVYRENLNLRIGHDDLIVRSDRERFDHAERGHFLGGRRG